MSNLKIKKYKGFEIHYVHGLYKYDVYNQGLWYNSFNSLSQVREYIKNVIWTRKNIPL